MQNNFEKSSVPSGHQLQAQFCPTQPSKVLSCASFEEKSSHLKFGRPRLLEGRVSVNPC